MVVTIFVPPHPLAGAWSIDHPANCVLDRVAGHGRTRSRAKTSTSHFVSHDEDLFF